MFKHVRCRYAIDGQAEQFRAAVEAMDALQPLTLIDQRRIELSGDRSFAEPQRLTNNRPHGDWQS
jgi:hypothetical protein